MHLLAGRKRADLRRGVVLVVLATMVAFPVAISAAIAFYIPATTNPPTAIGSGMTS
jgi:hypothetical protein